MPPPNVTPMRMALDLMEQLRTTAHGAPQEDALTAVLERIREANPEVDVRPGTVVRTVAEYVVRSCQEAERYQQRQTENFTPSYVTRPAYTGGPTIPDRLAAGIRVDVDDAPRLHFPSGRTVSPRWGRPMVLRAMAALRAQAEVQAAEDRAIFAQLDAIGESGFTVMPDAAQDITYLTARIHDALHVPRALLEGDRSRTPDLVSVLTQQARSAIEADMIRIPDLPLSPEPRVGRQWQMYEQPASEGHFWINARAIRLQGMPPPPNPTDHIPIEANPSVEIDVQRPRERWRQPVFPPEVYRPVTDPPYGTDHRYGYDRAFGGDSLSSGVTPMKPMTLAEMEKYAVRIRPTFWEKILTAPEDYPSAPAKPLSELAKDDIQAVEDRLSFGESLMVRTAWDALEEDFLV